ncbi:MAG: PQQ-dependent catabolism-associated CXXCW motif protein [Pseudomonadota bacterium]
MRATALALAVLLPLAAAADPVPEPTGYRMEAFRAPVPETLSGAFVVDTGQAEALWRAGIAFVDVMPRDEKPANLPEGTLWIDKPRKSIPGALWVPNVGYGRIHPDRAAYFLAALDQVTAGDRDAPLLIFCREDCWMSWNAARRAILDHGFTRVFWYPDGTDGWAWEELPFENITLFELAE